MRNECVYNLRQKGLKLNVKILNTTYYYSENTIVSAEYMWVKFVYIPVRWPTAVRIWLLLPLINNWKIIAHLLVSFKSIVTVLFSEVIPWASLFQTEEVAGPVNPFLL